MVHAQHALAKASAVVGAVRLPRSAVCAPAMLEALHDLDHLIRVRFEPAGELFAGLRIFFFADLAHLLLDFWEQSVPVLPARVQLLLAIGSAASPTLVRRSRGCPNGEHPADEKHDAEELHYHDRAHTREGLVHER